MHAPNLSGQTFEKTLDQLFAVRGFQAMPVMRMIRAVDEIATRRVHRNMACQAGAGNPQGRKMVDFVIEAEPGHYNTAMFPGHDATQPVRIAIEAKSQQVSGSTDEKLLGTYERMLSLPQGFTHMLLVTDIPAASSQALAKLHAIFRGPGLVAQNKFGNSTMKANTNSFQWIDITPFTAWLICAFPGAADRINLGKAPIVFTP